jgi:hypothetical protein
MIVIGYSDHAVSLTQPLPRLGMNFKFAVQSEEDSTIMRVAWQNACRRRANPGRVPFYAPRVLSYQAVLVGKRSSTMSAKSHDAAKIALGRVSIGTRLRQLFDRYSFLVGRTHDRYEQPKYRLVWGGWMAAFVCFVFANGLPAASAQSFDPILELSSWYTDRSLVDVEIVGSTSLLPQFHRLEPERSIQLRLERAYLTTLFAKKEPGYEIVMFGVDMESGLPSALPMAKAMGGAFHEDISGVPQVPYTEILPRSLVIVMQSDVSESDVDSASQEIEKCRGAALADELFAFEEGTSARCRHSSFPEVTHYYLASYLDVWLEIACRETMGQMLDCELQFPFKGFGVKVDFYHGRLAKWRDVVTSVAEFLKSKEYH